MNCFIFILFIFCSLFVLSIQTNENSSYYRAGVVEFQYDYNENKNLNEYLRIIKESKFLDIIVFPESTLNHSGTYIPDPLLNITPCNNDSYNDNLIQQISCAAKTKKLYVVINLTERSNCTRASQNALNDTRPCANNNLNMYNTNVVFDRNGTVISRYRKFNLFGEYGINTTLTADISTFKTDFNVTFGHFICFDLMFHTPPFDILSQGITDIIYPTMWFSELPFLTAVQYQQNWAYTNNVNLLASGASNPSRGSTGTGIYAGRLGSLVSVMNYSPEIKLYEASIPKRHFISNDPIYLTRYPNKNSPIDMLKLELLKNDLQLYTTIELDITEENSDVQICHNELCCDISVKISVSKLTPNQEAYNYRFVAFDGVRSYQGIKTGGETVCGIIACTNNEWQSCGSRFDKRVEVASEVNFLSILISGRFEGGSNMMTLPTSVDTSIMPLPTSEFNYIQTQDYEMDDRLWRNVTYQLPNPHSDLLTFAIFSRNFEKDGQSPFPSGSNLNAKVKYMELLIICICGFMLFYNFSN